MSERGWVDYAGVLASKKKQVIIYTLVCCLAAGLGSSVMPKTYKSGLTMDVGVFSMVIKRSGGSQEVPQEISTEPLEPVLTVRDSINSEPFLAAVISRLGLKISPASLKKRVKAKINEDLEAGPGRPINRQVIVSTKGGSPEEAKAVAETVAELVIEKHARLYDQALENRLAYEEDLKGQIDGLGSDVGKLRETLERYYRKTGSDTAALVLLQTNLYDKERHIAELTRELSRSQLLDKTTLKSTNTRVTVPAYLPQEPVVTWYMTAVIGLFIGFLLSSGYFILREALGTRSQGE